MGKSKAELKEAMERLSRPQPTFNGVKPLDLDRANDLPTHVEAFIKQGYGDITTKDLLIEANLRLKQLVALKVLESIHEGRGIYYDEELAEENLDEAIELERQENELARDSFTNQFKYATKCLDELLEARTNDIIENQEREVKK